MQISVLKLRQIIKEELTNKKVRSVEDSDTDVEADTEKVLDNTSDSQTNSDKIASDDEGFLIPESRILEYNYYSDYTEEKGKSFLEDSKYIINKIFQYSKKDILNAIQTVKKFTYPTNKHHKIFINNVNKFKTKNDMYKLVSAIKKTKNQEAIVNVSTSLEDIVKQLTKIDKKNAKLKKVTNWIKTSNIKSLLVQALVNLYKKCNNNDDIMNTIIFEIFKSYIDVESYFSKKPKLDPQSFVTFYISNKIKSLENVWVTEFRVQDEIESVLYNINDDGPNLAKTLLSKMKSISSIAASKNDVYGKFAFATGRTNSFPISEPNTKIEDKVERELGKHFDNTSRLTAPITKSLQGVLKKDLYTDVIHEPKQKVVYRGMSVSKKWLQAVLKKKDIPKKGSINKKFKFIPKDGQSSSWTIDRSVADDFKSRGGNDYQIIMHARIADNPNSFLSPDGMYKLNVASEYDNEKEAVGLSTIKVHSISWEAQQGFDDSWDY